jgi:alpha-L-rhamnosidase
MLMCRLYATAFGVYVPYLNGERVHDSVLNPGWTSYKHNHRYQVYDLTPFLKRGRNVISADLGCGWYMSRLGNPGGKVGKNCLFGDRWGLLVQLDVDGRTLVKTDDSWSWARSEVLFSEIYDGEHVDTNLIDVDWWKAPKAEGSVETLEFPKGKLHTSDAPFVRPIQELPVKEVIRTPEGKTVLDFGQNLVGWVKIKTDLQGGELVIRHAEVMEDGELGTRPLRTAKAEARIKLGGPTKGWEPKFTFFGFR